MTIDLTENKIPFGLLSKEEQEHLHHWLHGVMVWEPTSGVWSRTNLAGFYPDFVSRYAVYRTIPAPVETERETVWVAYDDAYGTFLTKFRDGARRYLRTARSFAFRLEYDAETGDSPTITKETFDDQ